jgi:hypothetical protein
MSPIIHDTLKYGLFAVLVAALGAGFWANGRMMRRARELGYGIFDLRRLSVHLTAIEFPIFIAAVLVGFAAANGIAALR